MLATMQKNARSKLRQAVRKVLAQSETMGKWTDFYQDFLSSVNDPKRNTTLPLQLLPFLKHLDDVQAFPMAEIAILRQVLGDTIVKRESAEEIIKETLDRYQTLLDRELSDKDEIALRVKQRRILLTMLLMPEES